MAEFKSGNWSVDVLINQSDGRKDPPADRLFALSILWLSRANDLDERQSGMSEAVDRLIADGCTAAYRQAAKEIIMALDVVYPGWREQGLEKLIPRWREAADDQPLDVA